jgi:RpiB/LacA/LacB family sugar-phosphate isomerase
MKISIANDHGGYILKKKLMNYLQTKQHKIINEGSDTTEIVRYPYYAAKVARAVSSGEVDRGILICNTGIGMSIVANKFKGVRASVVSSCETAELTRLHNDSNILCLGGKYLSFEKAKEIVDIWLNTDFEGGRHSISVNLIDEIENSDFNCYDREAKQRRDEYYLKDPTLPAKILIDTDMLTDCDDIAALAMLLNLKKRGDAEVLGVTVSSANELSAPATSAVLNYYGCEDIPIGIPEPGQGGNRNDSCFLPQICAEFPHKDKFERAVRIMRRALANAEDNSVKIVTIGYLTNLASLLKSSADDISELSGVELIEKKVMEWVCMGGNFPDDPAIDNVNFTRDKDNALYCLRNYKGRITFVGREIGHNIFVGNNFRLLTKSSPLYRSYQLHRGRWGDNWDHHTADPCTVLYAVFGCGERFEVQSGSMTLQDDCAFTWNPEIKSNKFYLLQKQSRADTAKEINDIIMNG